MDRHNMLQILTTVPDQIKKAVELGTTLKVTSPISRIVVAGMGGSGFPGYLLKSILRECALPVFVCQGYKLPKFVNEDSLVFIVSYSGNTEETILMYSDALKKKAKIILITAGGKLRYLAAESDIKTILVPAGLPPRLATPSLFFPILNILEQSGFIDGKLYDLQGLITTLSSPAWLQRANDLADKLHGSIPLIYTPPSLEPVARRWKIMLNENAKMHAFFNIFSELCHNELEGFTNINGNFHVIMFHDERDIPQLQKRMQATKKVLQEKGVQVTEIGVKGQYPLNKIYSAMHLGDLTSYYLALKNNTDPSPTPILESLKELKP